MAEEITSIDQLHRKSKLTGRVMRIELYGAFVDIGIGTPAILHISQLGENGKRVDDLLKIGQEITVWVDKVDVEKKQVIVTMVEPLAVEWQDLSQGLTLQGKVTRLENFGAFVDIGAEKEGLVHISELSHDYIKHPSQAVNVGDEVAVQVLDFSKRKRRINLSMKALQEKPQKEVKDHIEQVFDYAAEYEEEEDDMMPTAMEMALRSAMGTNDNFNFGRRGKKAKNKQRYRHEQDDILSRTLDYHR